MSLSTLVASFGAQASDQASLRFATAGVANETVTILPYGVRSAGFDGRGASARGGAILCVAAGKCGVVRMIREQAMTGSVDVDACRVASSPASVGIGRARLFSSVDAGEALPGATRSQALQFRYSHRYSESKESYPYGNVSHT